MWVETISKMGYQTYSEECIPWHTSIYYPLHPSARSKAFKMCLPASFWRISQDYYGGQSRVYEAILKCPDITCEDQLTQVDYKVKAMSIWRLTHDMGPWKWRKINRPYVTPIHATKRLNWALAYRYFTPEDWKRVFLVGWNDYWTRTRCSEGVDIYSFKIPASRDELGIQMTLSKGEQTKQMFWACFSGAPRKTGLIPGFFMKGGIPGIRNRSSKFYSTGRMWV